MSVSYRGRRLEGRRRANLTGRGSRRNQPILQRRLPGLSFCEDAVDLHSLYFWFFSKYTAAFFRISTSSLWNEPRRRIFLCVALPLLLTSNLTYGVVVLTERNGIIIFKGGANLAILL